MKCPFFKKRIGTNDWNGIKCGNQTLGNPYTTNWSYEKREEKISKYCNGDYKNCIQYKNNKTL